jgi:hypothetical protein
MHGTAVRNIHVRINVYVIVTLHTSLAKTDIIKVGALLLHDDWLRGMQQSGGRAMSITCPFPSQSPRSPQLCFLHLL